MPQKLPPKIFIIYKNSLFSQIKQNSIKLAIKLCIDYNEMNILQYVCPQYPHSMKLQIIFTEMAKLAHISSVLQPCWPAWQAVPKIGQAWERYFRPPAMQATTV
jgi:hypothetical protein